MKKLLALLPLALAAYVLHLRYEALHEAARIVANIEKEQHVIARIALQKEQILARCNGSDPQYVRKESEAFSFVQPQIRRLQISGYSPDLSLLRSNHLQWVESPSRTFFGFQETDFHLANPVFMNGDDLKKFLVFIEGVVIDPYIAKEKKPQLVIRDFELTRKTVGTEEVYAVNLQLTQRTK